jgi:hypothetical protein
VERIYHRENRSADLIPTNPRDMPNLKCIMRKVIQKLLMQQVVKELPE